MTSPEQPAEEAPVVVTRRATPGGCAWRAGCIIIWLPLMLLPLALLILAIQGEVALWHGSDFPAGAEHPLFQAKLLMDIDTRGLNVTQSYVSTQSDDGAACIQTHVRFVLWQGEGEPVDYCDCYTRTAEGGPWALESTAPGLCEQQRAD